MQELTSRQREVLSLIRDYMRHNGVPPTRAELAGALGFRSPNAAEEHLRALARKGALELVPGASRGIRLPAGSVGLPVVGRVAAGDPILAEQHIEEHLEVDPGIFHAQAHYLLRVHGMSMRDAGILDGDLLAVHRSTEAANGQIVVARLDDEVTVKRLQRRAHWVRLVAENPDFEDIRIDLREQALYIEGIGVGVVRQHVT